MTGTQTTTTTPEELTRLTQRLYAALTGPDATPSAGAVAAAQRFAQDALAAEASRAEAGFARDEHLAALARRLAALEESEPDWRQDVVLGVLTGVELVALADALREHLSDSRGASAFHERLLRHLETSEFDHRKRANFVFAGTPKHEGRFDGTQWLNWAEDYRAEPDRYLLPGTEEALCEAVASGQEVRVVGGGHSFNAGPLSPDTMISLDDYDRVLDIDTARRTARVQAGIRLRDLNKALDAAGLGLPVLGSTDPQSIGGLIATDLHGTGREHGFLSTQVTAMRVVDASGTARTVRVGDPLFHAVFGAVGVCGVVAEVELKLVDAFRMEKVAEIVDYEETAAGIEDVLAADEHVSFYCIGGAKRSRSMQIHRWNRTEAPLTKNWERRKRRTELRDFQLSAFAPGLTRLAADLEAEAAEVISPRTALVLPGSRAFGRKLYYRHDELECGVPFDRWKACLDEVIELHRSMRRFSVIEVRFTPDRSHALIAPGVGRRTCYIGLATPLDVDHGELYPAVEDILLRYDGRPHLGKQTFVTAADMQRAYGERFTRFQAIRREQDPSGRFLNEFTTRLFGDV